MVDFMNKVMNAQIKQAEAMIDKHKINIEILTKNASGVAEHPDYLETIQSELDKIAHWEDQIHVIEKWFGHGNEDNKKESYWTSADLKDKDE